MKIREKKHRLSREYYQGEALVAFTLCVNKRYPLFRDNDVVKTFHTFLIESISDSCLVPVYCFMPDHLHFILWGRTVNVDLLKTVTKFKQKSGFWLSKNKPEVAWQKDFYDHVIRKDEDLIAQVRYVLNNPVRKDLVEEWDEYLHSGSIGISLQDVLNRTW